MKLYFTNVIIYILRSFEKYRNCFASQTLSQNVFYYRSRNIATKRPTSVPSTIDHNTFMLVMHAYRKCVYDVVNYLSF